MTNQTTFDPDVQPSARDRAGSISPTSMSSANTPDNSMVATSVTCNSPYRILSLSDMVDEDKDGKFIYALLPLSFPQALDILLIPEIR